MPRFINGKEKGKNYHIAVAGIIGSGKTTASKLLASALGYHLFEENVGENSFLPFFYRDQKRWAFHSQLFYLREKASQLQKIRDLLDYTGVVHDSPLYQDAYTYAKAQQVLGNMTKEEYSLYEKFLTSFKRDLPAPDLIVQLDAMPRTIFRRIKERGRDYEQNISPKYIETLAQLQDQWIEERPQLNILRVNTETLDIAANPVHQKEFLESIFARLS